MTLAADYPDLFNALESVIPACVKFYLVGGAVRDLLTGRTINDFDFVSEGLVRPIGRKLAAELGGQFYVMDDEREIVRVIVNPTETTLGYNIDIAQIAGERIEEDLAKRDFTINAVAIEVVNNDRMVDPLNGVGDLRRRILKMCSAESLRNDPMRTVRAIRMALEFDLRMDDELISAMHEILPYLEQSAKERYRDEILKLLKQDRCGASFELLRHFGMLEHYFPAYSEEHCDLVRVVADKIDQLTECLAGTPDDNKTADLIMGSAVLRLNSYRCELRQYLNHAMVLYHSCVLLLKLCVFLKGLPQRDEPQRAGLWMEQLLFAAEEVSFMKKTLSACSFLHEKPKALITDLDVYHFFRLFGSSAICGWLLFAAEWIASDPYSEKVAEWEGILEVGSRLMEARFHRSEELVDPQPLLSGNEIISLLEIAPGPLVGKVKQAMLDAQVSGVLHTREEAVEFCKTFTVN